VQSLSVLWRGADDGSEQFKPAELPRFASPCRLRDQVFEALKHGRLQVKARLPLLGVIDELIQREVLDDPRHRSILTDSINNGYSYN
jgi:hypothetical protein